MTDSQELYFLLRWKSDESWKGWPRYEVRPMRGINDDPQSYDVIEENLEADVASVKRKRFEQQEIKERAVKHESRRSAKATD